MRFKWALLVMQHMYAMSLPDRKQDKKQNHFRGNVVWDLKWNTKDAQALPSGGKTKWTSPEQRVVLTVFPWKDDP